MWGRPETCAARRHLETLPGDKRRVCRGARTRRQLAGGVLGGRRYRARSENRPGDTAVSFPACRALVHVRGMCIRAHMPPQSLMIPMAMPASRNVGEDCPPSAALAPVHPSIDPRNTSSINAPICLKTVASPAPGARGQHSVQQDEERKISKSISLRISCLCARRGPVASRRRT